MLSAQSYKCSWNERADKLAKPATLSQDYLAYELYPYTDFYPGIKKAILNEWQEFWGTVNNNKLKAIKGSVKVRPALNNNIRNAEVVLARLLIGHTRLIRILNRARAATVSILRQLYRASDSRARHCRVLRLQWSKTRVLSKCTVNP